MADDEDKIEIPKLRTFKTDAEQYVKEKNLSELDIKRSAYVAKTEAAAINVISNIPYKAVAYGAVVILVLGAGVYLGYKFLYSGFFGAGQAPAMQEESKAPVKFLSAEEEKILTFSEANPGELIAKIKMELARNPRFGTVEYLPIKAVKANRFVGAKDFITYFSWQAPKEFLESLTGEFNLMVFYGSASNDVVVIMKTANFTQALAALLSWEKTMWLDWKPFLVEADIKNIQQFYFADDIIKNNDARVLKNNPPAGGGRVILGYSFFNRQFIIFSTSRDAISAVLDRLIALPPR